MNICKITTALASAWALSASPVLAATQACRVSQGTVAGGNGAYRVDLDLTVDGVARPVVQFSTPLPVTTDGAPNGFNTRDFSVNGGLNLICNQVRIYRLDDKGRRIEPVKTCAEVQQIFTLFRDNNWRDLPELEVVWRPGFILIDKDGRAIPCIYQSGPYAGFMATATNLKNGLDGAARGECDINDQVDPRQIAGLTIQGGHNFIRASGVQLGDLALVTVHRPSGDQHIPVIVVDSGGLGSPAMGTIDLNAKVLGRPGPFDTHKAVLGLDVSQPVTVTIFPGSFGYHLERPFTNAATISRMGDFIASTGLNSAEDLVNRAIQCAAQAAPATKPAPPRPRAP